LSLTQILAEKTVFVQALDNNGRKIYFGTTSQLLPRESFRAGTSVTERLHYFSHDTAIIDDNVPIGKDTKIWHFSHILLGSEIGDDCNIGLNVVIGPNVTIGNGCKIQNNVPVYQGVILEDEIFCGPSMVFANIIYPRAAIPRMTELRQTLVRGPPLEPTLP
jgi:UDP-2-acetamido-3-amino-2,3-dideoxy-glucuronate N-acetyltransferase